MQTSCDIEFENRESKVFHGGEPIRGTVKLSLAEPQVCRGIYVRIKGDGFVQWNEGAGDNGNTCTGTESYIDERVYIAGGQTGKDLLFSHVKSHIQF